MQSPALRRAQKLHAVAIQVIPLLGTAVAIARAVRHGVTAVELSLFAVFYVLGMMGMAIGLHRMLSHSSFSARPSVRAFFIVLGAMSVQGPPLYWVANHRRHHQFSDHPGDPHSPLYDGDQKLEGVAGLWHAYAGWTFGHELTNVLYYCRDLIRDPFFGWFNKHYYSWVALGLALPTAIGGLATQSFDGALGGLLWGGFVRIFATGLATGFINSLTHVFGSRAFNTTDSSRNAAWLAIPTLGESWHNNHHAFPTAAIIWFRWYQVDFCGVVIRVLEKLGLVWDVGRPAQRLLLSKKTVDPVSAPDLLSKGDV